jgi:hypothetical protein
VVVKALLQNERLRVGGSLNFDFRSTFEKGNVAEGSVGQMGQWATPPRILTQKGNYFNNVSTYYNYIYIIQFFDALGTS